MLYIDLHVVESCFANHMIASLELWKTSFVKSDVSEDDGLVGATAHHLNAWFRMCQTTLEKRKTNSSTFLRALCYKNEMRNFAESVT